MNHCTKTTHRQRFIPVNEISSKIGQDVSLCYPASHDISGCDTTSQLCKIGKRTAYNTIVVNIEDLPCLAEVSVSPSMQLVDFSLQRSMRCYTICSGENSCQLLNQLYATTMRAKVTNRHLSSRQLIMPFNNRPYASINRWLCRSTVMKHNQFFAIMMAVDGS